MLVLDLEIGDSNTTLINVYGPNTDDPNFYNEIATIMNDIDNTYSILCGDWNLIWNNLLDCINYTILLTFPWLETVLEMCNDFDLVDVWRIQNPQIRMFTWRQHRLGWISRHASWLSSLHQRQWWTHTILSLWTDFWHHISSRTCHEA